MGNKYCDTTLVDKAAKFAIEAHKNTERRGHGTAYVLHCFEAASIVESIKKDNVLIAAAMLHDTIEDTDTTIEQIRAEFGNRIAELVDSETILVPEGKTEEETWYERRKQGIENVKNGSMDLKIIAMGDKLSNMRAMYRDYQQVGEELWKRFHVTDKKLHEWRYRGLGDALSELSDTPAYKEYMWLVDNLFK